MTRPDRTHLSDSTFTAVFIGTLLFFSNIALAFPTWWARVIAVSLLAAIWGRILTTRLRKNRTAPPVWLRPRTTRPNL